MLDIQDFMFEQIPRLLLWFGIVSFVVIVLFLVFVKDKPPQASNPYADKTKVFVTKGHRALLKNRDFKIMMVMLFFGLKIFNAMTSIVDTIFDPDIAGLIGGVLIGGGILGAIIISLISDALHMRKVFLVIGMTAAVPLCFLIGYLRMDWLVNTLAFIFGFLIVSLLLVGLTYAAEMTFPIQEEVSKGMLMMIGQVAGKLFVFIPGNLFMNVSAGIFLIAAIVTNFIRDTSYYESQREINKLFC